MYDAIEVIERAGFKASIYYDQDAQSPDDWCTVGTLCYDTRGASHNRNLLPRDPYEYGMFRDHCDQCDGGVVDQHDDMPSIRCEVCEGSGYVLDGIGLARRMHNAAHVLPVRAWDDRNGTELRIADDWEEANGWIYATPDSIASSIVKDATSEEIEAALKCELGEWQKWAQGDVYGIVIEDPAGNHVDSCWGFYGFDYAKEEAASMLDLPEVRAIEQFPGLADLKVC